MKICCSLLAVLLFSLPVAARAHLLEELWHKYAPAGAAPATPLPAEREQPPAVPSIQSPPAQTADAPPSAPARDAAFPGRILGAPQGEGESAFDYAWKYRRQTYELHYEQPGQLARAIYGLALFVKDVSPDLPREKFYGGVLGCHYAVWQICQWLNDGLDRQRALTPEESQWVDMLLRDDVLRFADRFAPGGGPQHVLAAAPGKKRPFARNLRHERLHIFWDEDPAFQAHHQARWIALSEEERQAARDKLKNYAQNNEAQLVEEWAVYEAESLNMSLQ